MAEVEHQGAQQEHNIGNPQQQPPLIEQLPVEGGNSMPPPPPPRIIPLLFPPNHYRDSNKECPDLQLIQMFTNTYRCFGQEYEFQKVTTTEPPQNINQSCKTNLKALNMQTTKLIIDILKSFGKADQSEMDQAGMVSDLKTHSNSFMEVCKELRINEAYLKLIEKRRKDIAEINSLSDRIETKVEQLDRKFSLLASNRPRPLVNREEQWLPPATQ